MNKYVEYTIFRLSAWNVLFFIQLLFFLLYSARPLKTQNSVMLGIHYNRHSSLPYSSHHTIQYKIIKHQWL